MLANLKALVISVWMAASPSFGTAPAAGPISDAIAIAVLEDAPNAPVFGSHAEDAAVLAEIVREESNVQLSPTPMSWDAKSGRACGAFQEQCAGLSPTIVGQARKALWLLHRGQETCPSNPAAPYLGGTGRRCHAGLARRIADRRVSRAHAILQRLLAEVGQEE